MKASTGWANIEGMRDKTKSANRGAVLELWKITLKSDYQKTYRENQDEQRLSMASQRRETQHQRRQNFDPTQWDAVHNISRNLRKKRSIQYWLEQHATLWETPYNWELINPIYNKYLIFSKKKNARKNKSIMWVFSGDVKMHCTPKK